MKSNPYTFIEFLKCRIKNISSFFKSHWELEDYPVRVRHQKVEDFEQGSRLTVIPWIARIINWWGMSGDGDTKEEALADLRNNFEKFRGQNKLPRPGAKVPTRFQFAPSNEIEQYQHIAMDFFRKVLDLDYNACLVTDESSLWHFHHEETNDHFCRKISAVYEVDVSDIESGNLVEILKRIDLLSSKY